MVRLPVTLGRTVVIEPLGAAALLPAGTAGASAVLSGPPCVAASRACVDLFTRRGG